MTTASHSSECIACGSKKAELASITFMAQVREYPICDACAPYVERVFSDPSFGAAFLRFVGIAKMKQAHQSGGAFSCAVPRGAAPDDLEARMSDFEVYCEFFGDRIRTLRSHEPAA